MAMFDDPGKALRDLERELKAAEPTREEPGEAGADFGRMLYADETLEEKDVYYEEDAQAQGRRKSKSGCSAALLAVVEVLVIAGLIGGWLLWHK